MEILWVALAGVAGTLSRYGMTGVAYRILGDRFPYGTLLVNVIGSIVIGFVMHVGISTALLPKTVRVAVTIGFLGAFTTFSSFSYETIRILEERMWGMATLNIASNVVLSLLGCWIGIVFAKFLLGR
ncbi:MAG: fluoride efflux transporter CrcB [bacterium]|nr:fluoride efflux transporter CrcB [bacterium]